MRRVADGHRQRVAGIFGFDHGLQPQQRLHHHLDLPFARLAIAHHAGLDFQRRIFAQFEPGFGDGQQGDPRTCASFRAPC